MPSSSAASHGSPAAEEGQGMGGADQEAAEPGSSAPGSPPRAEALPAPRRRSAKIVLCYVLAFDRPSLEAEYQRQHGEQRAAYDVIRGGLRAAAWAGFATRAYAAGRASVACVLLMLLAGAAMGFGPLALLLASPGAFIRWRSVWVGAWNVAHAASVSAFYLQLHSSDPAHDAFASPPPAELSPAALAGRAAWLVWHSQALVMLLNAAGPLVNTFRYFLHAQLMIYMLYLRRNPQFCAASPQMRSAVAAVHARLLRPALRAARAQLPAGCIPGARALRALLGPHAAAAVASAAAAAAAGDAYPASPASVHLCSLYLPLLQLCLGLLLPCALAYRAERAQRRAFLAERGFIPEQLLLHRELGLALLAAALQLAAALHAS
ncbi:hypothetical protein ABPG75_010210 [Micractinium tetrahymenae]